MRRLPVLLAPAALLILPGCVGFKTWEPAPKVEQKPFWAPTPSTLRLHPATRIVHHGVKPSIDLRVRLLDEMGDPIKASGTWSAEARLPASGGQATGVLVGRWSQEVVSRDAQVQFYDPISGAYRFLLPLADNLPLGTEVGLQVVFSPSAEGKRLVVDGEIAHRH